MSKELIYAIRNGNLSRIRKLIGEGADPNFRLPAESDHGAFLDQVTALMVAVAAPRATAEIVQFLLAHGADPFAVSAGEVSPTWYACGGGTGYPLTEANLRALEPDHPFHFWGGGDLSRLRLILDAGGDPNEFASNGRSCVFEACSVGDPERLRLLIERGADVGPSVKGKRLSAMVPPDTGVDWAKFAAAGTTYQLIPLFAAASAGSLDCVELIVEAGFPVDFELDGDNALTEVGSVEVAEYLWDQGLRIGSGSLGFDAIDEAMEADNLWVLRFLLSKVDLATRQEKLLMASGLRMNPRAVRLILELGADPNKPSQDYGSPLHAACWQGDGNAGRANEVVAETIQILIDAGADPDLLSRGRRPLHEAAFGDWASPTSVRVLLDRGADVDALDEHGQTALMIAARLAELACVRLLLAAGANRSLRDGRGKIALDYANAQLSTYRSPLLKLFHQGIFGGFGGDRTTGDEAWLAGLECAQEIVDLLSR